MRRPDPGSPVPPVARNMVTRIYTSGRRPRRAPEGLNLLRLRGRREPPKRRRSPGLTNLAGKLGESELGLACASASR